MQLYQFQSSTLRRSVSALLLAQMLWLMVLASAAGLHEHSHHHAHGSADCAVSFFTHGGMDAAQPEPLLVARASYSFASLETPESVLLSRARFTWGVLEHAPPRVG